MEPARGSTKTQKLEPHHSTKPGLASAPRSHQHLLDTGPASGPPASFPVLPGLTPGEVRTLGRCEWKPGSLSPRWAPSCSAAHCIQKDRVWRRCRVLASPCGPPHTITDFLKVPCHRCVGLTCHGELGLQDGGNDKHLPLHAVHPGMCWDTGARQPCRHGRQRECVLAPGWLLRKWRTRPLRGRHLSAARLTPPRLTGRKLWRFEGLGCLPTAGLPECCSFSHLAIVSFSFPHPLIFISFSSNSYLDW